ncbi:MAG: 30S ribosomal protein S4 [Patescibacteria group bacterium]
MIIKSKYKIARRVGAPIFEKTQTQKFAMRSEKKGSAVGAGAKGKKGGRQKSEFGLQMIEKQKARFTYILSERQFSNYVKKAIANKTNTVATLFSLLERRLDNTVYRLGFAPTRAAAKQLVSHGHINVNGKRVSIRSYQVSLGEVVGIRENSKAKTIFVNLDQALKDREAPIWLKRDEAKREGTVVSLPDISKSETMFDLNTVVEFYNR